MPIRIQRTSSVQNTGRIYRPRGQGFWYEPSDNADLLFVTLDKTEREYSPTTLYEDDPMSPTELHWESQNTTSPLTGTSAGRDP